MPGLFGGDRPVHLQLFGEEKDDELGNWQDHEVVQGTLTYAGWNAIDLRASTPFRIKFAYPTQVKIVWMIAGPMGGDMPISVRVMNFRKNDMWYFSPAKKAAWTAYPITTRIWAMQTSPTKKRY